jgi:hypothetical protein
MTEEAFYRRESETRFVATHHTQGPWDERFQHAGPPAALLTQLLEAHAGDGLLAARLTFDILGPIPIGGMDVQTRVVRPGRQVQLAEAELRCDGRLTMRAAAWFARAAPADLPPTAAALPPPFPDRGDGDIVPWWRCGFIEAMEWRFVAGHYTEIGPATVWERPRYPLLDGEAMSAAARTVIAVDSANGVSSELDIRRWRFIPPGLSVHLQRPARGEWICMEATTALTPDAPGLTTARLFDRNGPIGVAAQSLFVAPVAPQHPAV